MSDLKEKFIQYLEHNELQYVDRDSKISHCCINPSHIEEHPSAVTFFTEGNELSICKSCGFTLGTEALYKFLDVGIDENVIFKAQIERLLKEKLINLGEVEHIKIYLPIKDGDFSTHYRGISPETYQKVGAYYTFPDAYYGKRIIIPIKDIASELRTFEAISTNKALVPKVLRPKNQITSNIFGFEQFLGNSDTVFITEGLFSALSFWELGYQGVFNFGVASIKDKIKTLLLKGVKNVILAGDADSAGKQFNKECYHLLKHNFNVTFFQFPYNSPEKYDSNDLLKQGREILQECIDKSLSKGLIKIKYNKIQETN